MNIDTNELEHITNMLTNAHLVPLQKEIQQLKEVLAERDKTVAMMRLAMAAKEMQIQNLTEELEHLQAQQAQEELNVWMCQQFIPLSKQRTQAYVVRIQDAHDRAFLSHFILSSLPQDAPHQLADEVTQMTQLLEPQKEQPSISHADQVILTAEGGAAIVHTQNGKEEQ